MLCVNLEMKMHIDTLYAMLAAEFLLPPFSPVLGSKEARLVRDAVHRQTEAACASDRAK